MPRRILIADDNKAFREHIKNRLKLSLVDAIYAEAEDGLDAVNRAQSFKADLIILDISMPVMDGVQAAKILRESLPDVPIVVCTTYDFGQELASNLKVDAVINKTEGLRNLSTCVRALLESRQRSGTDGATAKTDHLKYPWQRLVKHATKPGAEDVDSKIKLAEVAIFTRIQALSSNRGQHDEWQALADAMKSLRMLKTARKNRAS